MLSATGTLGLGCLGSSVLPTPYAFSKTGVACGLFLMLVVAYANAFTAELLLKAAAATRTDTYEACAEAVGGRRWKIWVQVTLLALLFGNTCGSVALLSDVGNVIMAKLQQPPDGATLAAGSADGLAIQLLLVFGLVFPLCMLRDIRSLDNCAPLAALVIVALIGAIMYRAIETGFPAIASGDMPIWVPTDVAAIPEAVSLLGFAFYLHPCLIPVLREMPPGGLGLRATVSATRVVLYGICMAVYGATGFFGASSFGEDTKGDVLQNEIIGGTPAVVLISAVAAYLAVSIPPIFHVLRSSFRQLVTPGAEFSWVRHSLETAGLLGAAVAVSILFSSQAEKIFAITGSTGVCMACYVLPICIYRRERHARFLAHQEATQLEADASETLSHPLLDSRQRSPKPPQLLETVTSFAVLFIGVATSVLALWVALSRS
eukprot:jgi/Tetstr1/446463/TSEL_034004.t1